MKTTATTEHISNHLRELLEGIGADNLDHIVAAMRARDYVPDSLAAELASELADILLAPPMDTEFGPLSTGRLVVFIDARPSGLRRPGRDGRRS